MIDPQVAFDKLAQFETADEIADYLVETGIQGLRHYAFACPIAKYMNLHTGFEYGVTVDAIELEDWDERTDGPIPPEFTPTMAMANFVIEFDQGEYPFLEARNII